MSPEETLRFSRRLAALEERIETLARARLPGPEETAEEAARLAGATLAELRAGKGGPERVAARRQAALILRRQCGWPVPMIARRLGLSRRRVYEIVGENAKAMASADKSPTNEAK